MASEPYLSDPDVVLYNGDALEVLRQLPDASVDCCVTSPPYADARPDVPAPSLNQFADWMNPVLRQLLRVVRPTGSLLLNLGRRFKDGEEHTFNEQTARRAVNVGWYRIDTLIWSKTNPSGKGSPYLTNAHEYVYWFGRTTSAYRGFDETRTPYSDESLARFKRAPRPPVKLHTSARPGTPPHPLGRKPWSVFTSPVGAEKGNPHPSPMAPQLASFLVSLGCPPGGSVLDPFAGSSNVLRAARLSGRYAIGIEIDEAWCDLSARRLQQLSLLAEA